ncbi:MULTISPECIES: hypothetical protein [Methylobacterium]|uniref:Anti-sigma factor NepR domain-containing protein n=1 Tax=Methylobacterium jeotgali TaxID=381630 RepID=A0ABQ4SXU5_9HYPH|nr:MULTISPECIES: hypothetical protein [Methylobacterium]PIU12603.1 MAG: hypothetical protein COT28_14520 [Methylobacterium sp. CG08_land_8_20_14_0_20_71_15]GJE08024.1 hypothetical protein AOPFMNJM_3356 [Methylobacterium jeotgali]
MAQGFDTTDALHPAPAGETAMNAEARRRIGTVLRSFYESRVEAQPLPDSQIDLLLRLRHKERDRRRGD